MTIFIIHELLPASGTMKLTQANKATASPGEPPSVFLEAIGDTPLLRLLDFLVTSEDFDYPMTDIACLSRVHYNTLRTLWPQLERNGMVIMTRRVGKAKMYRFNRASPVAKKFKEFFWTVTKEEVHKRLAKSGKLPLAVKY